MKGTGAALMAVMLSASLVPQAKAADAVGFLCIAPIPEPNAGPQSLSNPAGGGRDFGFSIQVDDGRVVPLPLGESMPYGELPLDEEHLITVRRSGDIVESFRFLFERFRSSRLCLWFKPLYETWHLWPPSDSRHMCGCD